MIPIVYIPRHKLSFRQQNGVIACSLVPQDRISLSASKTITIVNQDGSSLTRLSLSVTTNGQTQFNIFTEPPAQHWLIVNGLEEYNQQAYEIQQVGPNWRIVWLNENYTLTTDMKLIFVTKTT